MSIWRDAFRRYELIVNVWPLDQRTVLRDALFASPPVERFLDRLKPWAQAPFNSHVCAQIDALAPTFAEAWPRFGMGLPVQDVFEDVYLAAIYLIFSEWGGIPWYRGQRRADWAMTPSIYRLVRTGAEFDVALAQVASFCEHVTREYPATLTELECVAIAQHYGVPTWLLDATRSPWVALYFASKGGADGDIGVVREIGPDEWDVAEVQVLGVRRIDRQHAVFLDAPHPDLFDQFVRQEIKFHQRFGLVFESTAFSVGDDLVRSDDPIVTVVESWRRAPTPGGLLASPPRRRNVDPLGPQDYFEMVVQRLRERGSRLSAQDLTSLKTWHGPKGNTLLDLYEHGRISRTDEAALRLVCRLHAEQQTRRAEISPVDRSLRHLWSAVAWVFSRKDTQDPDLWLWEHYKNSFRWDYVQRLLDTLDRQRE